MTAGCKLVWRNSSKLGRWYHKKEIRVLVMTRLSELTTPKMLTMLNFPQTLIILLFLCLVN